ncbi:PaaI family thioesterase [Rhodopseudomonas palustris]|uniref:PaaI family thioesterase n=1 Tax=Rhodopseudomonas palustris TaxID=1076 RepID=UPI0021F286CF|nr:PaaI family thioesterase [Rhodopseudomonas palustris]UYO43715.1 PaaI family thioesterase [Rhodopseudomonas palustris]
MTHRVGQFWDMIEGRRPAPPAAQLLGWKLLAIDPAAGSIEVEFLATESFLNPAGSVQGGLLGAMLDDTVGPAAMAFLGGDRMAQTLELKVSFIRPARPGRLVGRGCVVHSGREILFLEGELRDSDQTLIATATATARAVAGHSGPQQTKLA